jgi:hypothetical protein
MVPPTHVGVVQTKKSTLATPLPEASLGVATTVYGSVAYELT